MTSNPGNFIDFLDKQRERRDCRYLDFMNLLNTINYDYINNNFADTNFTGTNYYSIYSPSRWNTKTSYDMWMKKHEIDISTNFVVKEKEKKTINVEVEKLEDLLKIINENEYSDDIEYNIDLKSLHNVKNELIKLNNMIGMNSMKKSILDQMLYFIQGLHKGQNVSEFKHTVIYGQPGTGKTEVAKIVGEMYAKLGILKNNIFKKVTRNDLIAGYLGQTALKTRKVIDECLGGVLFIDEAYSLASSENSDIYSKECIDTICEALSDHKDNLMVIIAGYKEELEETFFRANRGLESRFIWRFMMDKYTPAEMMKIFKKKVAENEWSFEDEDKITEKWFIEKKNDFTSFGRDMELLLSYTKISHGRRIYGKDIEVRKKISLEDMNKGFEMMLANKTKKPDNTIMHTLFI
jgi:SpoVK/Ycf46/Vps4 family AAA+-type ATPase